MAQASDLISMIRDDVFESIMLFVKDSSNCYYCVQSPSETALLVQSVYWDQWYLYIKSAEYLCEMKKDTTYWVIGQVGEREKQREQIREEREVGLVERRNAVGWFARW